MTLNCILALESLKAYTKYLPLAVAGVSAIFIVIAFIIGFTSGGARVRWSGFAWLVSALGFVFADKYLHEKNPVYKMLSARGFHAQVVAFASSFTIALACILAVLLLYGLFTLILRRKRKVAVRAIQEKNAFEKAIKYGSYEGFDIDEDDEKSVRVKPTGIGRVLGGIICAVNTAMLIATLVCTTLLIVNATSLKNGAMSAIYTVPIIPKLLPYAEKYALDFAMIGVIFLVAVSGAKKGFTETVRVFLIRLGGIAAIALCFYLPFSRFASSNSFLRVIVGRLVGLAAKVGWSVKVYTICGKIAAALVLCVIAIAVLLLINALLKTLTKEVFQDGLLGVIDKMLAGVAFLMLGALLCAVIWGALYAFSHYGVFQMGGLTRGTSTLSSGFFETFDYYLKPWLERFTAKIKSIF